MAVLLNFIAFQVGWFACVLGAAYQMPVLGTSIGLTIVVLHLARAAEPVAEIKLIAAAAVIGIVVDSALAASGLITFTSGAWHPAVTAHWMVALWMVFATTLNVSLRWLKNRMALAVAFGAIGGPLAYLAGEKLGALQFQALASTSIAVGIGWAAAMALLVRLAQRFDGVGVRITNIRPA